jgi:hypothetical protein
MDAARRGSSPGLSGGQSGSWPPVFGSKPPARANAAYFALLTPPGWPFQEAVTPFTYSLLIYTLLLPGLYVSSKGRLMAGYWLFTAMVGLALVVWVHFVPTGDYEAPIEDIYAVYGNALSGLLALVVLAGLAFSLVTLVLLAIRSVRSAERP